MNEFEDRLRADLRHEPVAPDEAFVMRVSTRLARSEMSRRVILVVACLVAGALASAMAAGLFAAGSALAVLFGAEWQPKSGEPPVWIGIGVVAIAILGFALLLVPMRKAPR